MRLFCISRYQSSLGKYKAGDEVDVDDATADLLLRDSPGSFSFDKPSKKSVQSSEPEVEREDVGTVAAHARPQRKGNSR